METVAVVGALVFVGFLLVVLWYRLGSLEKNQERLERTLREELARNRDEMARAIKSLGDSVQTRLGELTLGHDQRMEGLRVSVDGRLKVIQENNAQQLERMRATVDEKLHGTLEKRLGESFKQVSDRLEQVHKGLGEMQTLATGVGDLKRVLTNVKTRGLWGEIQLGTLLEEILTQDQYGRNVHLKDNSREEVEFAIKMPGGGGEGPLWLPVDAKFPTEDYQRLLDAYEKADVPGAEEATKMLWARLKSCAKDIRDKYINPPTTTDFAILFLPTEGLYAEVARHSDLQNTLRRDYSVVMAGPSTFAALLNSLQMGFRTLAIQKRSGEMWGVLGTIKNEFGKFSDLLDNVRKKLDQASTTMEEATKKSRTIEKRLSRMEGLAQGEKDQPIALTFDEIL